MKYYLFIEAESQSQPGYKLEQADIAKTALVGIGG